MIKISGKIVPHEKNKHYLNLKTVISSKSRHSIQNYTSRYRFYEKHDGTSSDCPIKFTPEPLRDIFISGVLRCNIIKGH